jgi:hypothetical protein
MLRFVKENKKFCAVVAVATVLVLALCYGLAVRNVFAVVLGALMLTGAVAFSFGAMVKEARRLRHK